MINPPPPVVTGHNLRIVRVDANGVLASRGLSIYRWTHEQARWERIYQPVAASATRFLNVVRLWRRFYRSDIVSLCESVDGGVVCIGRKVILRASCGSHELQVAFRVKRGTRPLGIAAMDGMLYWGEYFGNSDRQEVTVYGSQDSGLSWYGAYVFPAGSIRHIHRILADEERRRIWVLTGDLDNEAKVLWTDDHFATVHTASDGSQLSRAVMAVPLPGGLLWGTDMPDARNHIRLWLDDGGMRVLHELEGPCFYAVRAGEFILLSTDVEPSQVNVSGYSTLLVARVAHLNDWRVLMRVKKDRMPMRLFQFGNIILPDGPGDSQYAWASGCALEGSDGVVWRWSLDSLRAWFASSCDPRMQQATQS